MSRFPTGSIQTCFSGANVYQEVLETRKFTVRTSMSATRQIVDTNTNVQPILNVTTNSYHIFVHVKRVMQAMEKPLA